MRTAPLPENEPQRLRALRDLAVLDTPAEAAFDDITMLAARVCGRPISLLSLVDADRQWFKSKRGLEATETPRDIAFCAHAILNPEEVMVVADARHDARFADNPLVTGVPHIGFYAGAPLVTSDGEALGTLCVIDHGPGELSPADSEALRALARQAMSLLEQRNSEVTLLRAELEKSRHQIRTLEGKLSRYDEAQKSLRAEHSFREAVIDCAAEGVCVCHAVEAYPYLQFTVWNRRMTEITGYSMAEINRLGWYQSLYPDPEIQKQAIERMARMRQGDDLRFERWQIRCADGRQRALAISTSRLSAADGLQHVLALMHDLTEQEDLQKEAMLGRRDGLTGVRTRRAFREEAEKLFALASRNGTTTALGFMDLDYLKQVNDLMGHAEGDRVLECVGALLANATRSSDVVGRLGGDEFAILLPDTDATSARVFFDRLHGQLQEATRQRGWPVGLSLGVALFATGPPSESDALSYADNLMYRAKRAGRNRVVFAEYAPPKARVARHADESEATREAAERANESNRGVLSRMSHELRTPLNAILGFAQILRLRGETATRAQREDNLAQIERAGWRLLELIEGALDLSHVESGTMRISCEPVQLQRLCAECVERLQPLTCAADIAVFDRTGEGAPLSVLGDRTRLKQVLLNLLSNAVKYNRPGGAITLTLQAIDEDWVELVVEDTGPGFTAAQLRNLYEPFERLGTEAGTTEGMGIGLVVGKRLIELMGGRLDLVTTEGVGSRFAVRLRRAPETGEAS